MSAFPETPVTLLAKLAAQVTGEDEANWMRFADLYIPAIRNFAERRGEASHADDIVQEVMARLVSVFRGSRFAIREGKGNFRAYLAKVIRNQVYMTFRKEKSSRLELAAELDECALVSDAAAVTAEMDLEWYESRHRAAVDHALNRTLVSKLNKDLYRAYVLEEQPIGEVAGRFHVTRNQVSQAKSRLDRMISAFEAELGD